MSQAGLRSDQSGCGLYAGHSINQLAVSVRDQREYIVKFFLRPTALCAALTLNAHPALQRILPRIVHTSSGDDVAVDPVGDALPPFLVLEKGVSLRAWASHSLPDFVTAVQVRLCVCPLFFRLPLLVCSLRAFPALFGWLPFLRRGFFFWPLR
jgi:hypothetical protein